MDARHGVAVIPRRNEVDVVTEILSSDEYVDAKAMGRAVVVALTKELAKRDLSVVGIGFPQEGTWLPVGPFYDKRSTDKFVKAAQDNGMVTTVQPQVGPATLFEREPDDPGVCDDCTHRKEMHTGKYGCAVMSRVPKQKCPCTNYARKAAK